MDVWKCVGVLKRDGKLPVPSQSVTQNNLTKFLKLGQIANPSDLHWH